MYPAHRRLHRPRARKASRRLTSALSLQKFFTQALALRSFSTISHRLRPRRRLPAQSGESTHHGRVPSLYSPPAQLIFHARAYTRPPTGQIKNERNMKLDKMRKHEYVGTVYSSECCELLDRIDGTGLNVSLSQLPPECRALAIAPRPLETFSRARRVRPQHAPAAAKHIALRRKNTIHRDRDQVRLQILDAPETDGARFHAGGAHGGAHRPPRPRVRPRPWSSGPRPRVGPHDQALHPLPMFARE